MLLLQIALGALVAGLIDTVAGFGGALLLLPLLVIIAGERDAVVLSAFGSIGWSVTRVVLLGPLIDWSAVWMMGAGILPGVALGTLLLDVIDPETLRVGIGMLITLFGAYYVARLYLDIPRLPPVARFWMPLIGLLSGVIGTLLGAGHGPLHAVTMESTGMGARAIAATGGALGGITAIARTVGYAVSGTLDGELLLPGVICAAGGWLGALLGVRFARRSHDSTLELILGLVLILAGIRLLL